MTETNLSAQIATLNRAVEAAEAGFERGELSLEGVAETKRALDDIRLRLWGLLRAAGDEHPQTFQERFRIRRASELCDRLAGDLKLGTMSQEHAEWADLWIAANELSRAIETVRGRVGE
ncbi:MAG TPA: hypothetical protein VGQ17_16790 [Gemmatimonadales bacterium]|jgi:hypothetical protein|nr:hypothetical protein [Gemmatimonadales bacterium]